MEGCVLDSWLREVVMGIPALFLSQIIWLSSAT